MKDVCRKKTRGNRLLIRFSRRERANWCPIDSWPVDSALPTHDFIFFEIVRSKIRPGDRVFHRSAQIRCRVFLW